MLAKTDQLLILTIQLRFLAALKILEVCGYSSQAGDKNHLRKVRRAGKKKCWAAKASLKSVNAGGSGNVRRN